MIALHILDVKDFTTKLFLKDTFDTFYCSEASFTTFFHCSVDGSLHPHYFDSSDETKDRNYCRWEELRPYCRALIRGRHQPLHFRIVFQLSPGNIQKLLAMTGISLRPEDIFSLSLNFQFDNGKLICTTGSSLRFFTLDKTLDREWDTMVIRFFHQQSILFQEAS